MEQRAVGGRNLVLILAMSLTVLMGAAIVKTDGLAVAILPAALVGLLILWRPELGLIAMAFLIPFEDALLFAGGSTITKAAGLLVAAAWFLQKLLRRESWRRIVTLQPLRLVVLLIGLAWLSTLWAEWPLVVFPAVVRLVMLVAFCVLALDLTRRWNQLEGMARALVAGGTVASIMVVLQYSTGTVRRAGAGVAGGLNSTAMLLVTLVPFAVVLIRTKGLFWRLLGIAYICLAVIAIGQTLSRMSYIMLVLVLAWEWWNALRTPRSRLVSVLVLALIVGVGMRFLPLEVVQDRADTIVPYIESTLSPDASGTGARSGRGFHLAVASTVFLDHPWIGVGYANFGHYFLQYQFEVAGAGGIVYRKPRSAHSAYMALLADLGLVGTVLWVPFLVLLCVGLYRCTRWLRSRGDHANYLLVRALGISIGIFLAYGLYAEFQVQKLFWLLAGLALAVADMVRQSLASSTVAGETSAILDMGHHQAGPLVTTIGSTVTDTCLEEPSSPRLLT